MGNLLGEAIEFYVSEQVRARQELLGKGFNNPNLTTTDLNLINNKNAWLKLASSVYVGNPSLIKEANSIEGIKEEELNALLQLPEERLISIGLDIN